MSTGQVDIYGGGIAASTTKKNHPRLKNENGIRIIGFVFILMFLFTILSECQTSEATVNNVMMQYEGIDITRRQPEFEVFIKWLKTNNCPMKPKTCKVQILPTKNGQYYVRAIAKNGNVLFHSETLKTKRSCRKVIAYLNPYRIEDLTKHK